jgi:two-component system, chemotaxis family, response regulator Rcp1
MTVVQPIQILLVEDSDADVELTREVLRETKIVNDLHVVQDGDDALSFVRQEGGYADAPRPDLVLLDLNLPGRDGREVLEELKSEPSSRRIPVVILTTSAEDRDVLRAYDAHVNAYVTKPLGLDAFVRVARAIDDFWLSIVRLPKS